MFTFIGLSILLFILLSNIRWLLIILLRGQIKVVFSRPYALANMIISLLPFYYDIKGSVVWIFVILNLLVGYVEHLQIKSENEVRNI